MTAELFFSLLFWALVVVVPGGTLIVIVRYFWCRRKYHAALQQSPATDGDTRYWKLRERVENLVFDPIRRGGRTEAEIMAQLERMSLRDAEALHAPEQKGE